MLAYSLTLDEDRIATVVFDMPGKVNVMNEVFMASMKEIMDRLEGYGNALRGVILTSAKSTFFAGGDLALMLRAEPGQEAFLEQHFNELKGYFRRLEKLPAPVVAAINGTALGGGYELCLACHHRVALRRDRVQIGLPEVSFGILPAAGGVVRLSYLLGLASALPFLLGGRKVDVQTAYVCGLVDEIANTPEELVQRARDWILRCTVPPLQQWDAQPKTLLMSSAPLAERRSTQQVVADFSEDAKQNPAIEEILRVANLASSMDVDAVFAEETIGFVRLVLSENAKSRIGQFFESNRQKSETKETASR
ncbi:enoyl-CoA hydratase/isomerase family protein [Paraburkholderia sp. SIMBA_030]|uniref:enoyl-CoA hydratase/isomerase family protein n=1 Tax=Paraburkholderia sp. SIMBA_030 TaxID=3085773 RepID=UPI00397BC5B5